MSSIQKHILLSATAYMLACGVIAQSGDSSFFAFDRFGRRFTASELVMADPSLSFMGGGGCISAGIFNLDFSGDPGFTPARQAVACQVFSDLSALLVPADDPYTSAPNIGPFVNIRFRDFTTLNPPPPPNALAAASAYYSWLDTPQDEPQLQSVHDDYRPVPLMNGVLDGQVWNTINGGFDAWYCTRRFKVINTPQALAHGYVVVNWNAPNPWFLGPALPVPVGQYDLYTVLAHEAMHMLGFASGMDANLDCVFAGSEYVFRFDTHVSQSGSVLVLDPVLCDGNSWTSNLSGSFNTTPGNCTTEIVGTPIYAPATFEPGSSLSHFDGTCNAGVPFLMHPSVNNPAGQSRIPLQPEVDVLCAIDYRTNLQYGVSGSGWDGTVDSRAPCGSRLAGVDDIWIDYTTRDYYRIAQGGSITIDNFLDNDEDMSTATGEPLGFDCLEAIEGGTITALFNFPDPNPRFTFDADPGFVGWGRVSYRPKNFLDGRTGNITHVFIHIWPSSACDVPNCNILNGGTFESVAFRNGNVAPHDSYNQGANNSPDLFAFEPNGFPLSTIGPRPPGWYDFNNLTAPRSAFTRCNNPLEANPPSWSGAPANSRYAQVFCSMFAANTAREGLLFEVCRPLVPGYTYTLEYQGKNGGTCTSDWQFYAFQDRPCNPTQGVTTFTGPNPCGGAPAPYQLPVPQALLNNAWQAVSNAFVYNASFSAGFIIARAPVAIADPARLLIDDLVLRPQITADATIEPSCDNAPTGSITLDVHYYPGVYSVLWSNGATTAAITNLAAGTYTVTITDTDLGCGSFTETYTVGVVPCANDFTISKTVNDTYTYAGAPVLYTITVCNGTTIDQDVSLTDLGLGSNFVIGSTTPPWPNFPADPLTLFLLGGQCATIEISGYFTSLGTYTNCVDADPEFEDPMSACADAVTVLQNCPLMVSGYGDCVNGPVHLCLSEHSLIVDIKTIDFRWIFPTFLAPPTIGGAIIPVAAGGLDPSSSISAELPWVPMPGWSYVDVHLVFNNAISTSGSSTLLCVDVLFDGAVTPGVNVFQTFATTAPLYTINNHVSLLDSGGSPIQPGGFWTQAANIILTGCPDILTPPNHLFTIDQVLCTGEVSVTASLTDPNAIHMWTWGDDRTTPTNGAQEYTYNYFTAIPINQDPPYSVPPAPPGTYTITHTVILNGVASTSSQQVTVAPCCQAGTVIPDGSLASVVGTVFSGTIDVQGEFFVDDDVLFQNCQVFMEPGAEIIVQNGWTLDIDNASFTACNGVMWKSFTAENGSTVRIRRAYMDDAESTVAALDGSVVWVDGTQFHNNRVGVGIPDVGLPYNNVACWVSNSTFYSAGPMPQPYQGQATAVGTKGFAAVAVHNTTLDFTGGNNIIHTLSNGIVGHGSDMNVADCQMLNIQPDAAYAYTGNGAGIYANGLMSWNYLKQQGYGMSGMPSFNGCRWGVYTEYMNVRSTENRMLDMGTAYRVDRSGYREVDILNNKAFTHLHGMELRSNDGAAHILVQNNDITFGNAQCDFCRGYTAILVTEGNYVAPDSRILNNTIRFMNAPNSRFGIALTSADDWVVAENNVIMASNAFNLTGIQMTGCRRTEVSCNSVNSSDNTYPIDRQAAIRNVMGREPLISCNEMDQTANGILFNGVAYNTDVRGNQFHDHRWPLHLDATAIIDAQTLKGNLWDPNATAPVLGAWYEVSNLQAWNSLFLYDPNVTGTWPPTWSPPSWFDITSGNTYDCANHHGEHYCNQFGDVRCKDCLRELDEKIANDSLENDPYTDETKWMLTADLYKKLDDSPALLDSLPELDAFYTDLQGSTTAAFKAIADDQLALYNLDSNVVAQLRANQAQIDALMDLVKDGMEQLGDSTLTPAQQQGILSGLSGYRQSINSLSAWNASALQLASTTKVLTAEGVKTANSVIATTQLIEGNEKAVNEVFLATIGKDVDGFTANQSDDLFAIANQCPMVGGNAVFKARSLYWLIDDSYDFDDQALCLQHGIIVKSLTAKPVNAISVVPNPARDEAVLVLDRELDEPGTFVVYDAVGAEVIRLAVPIEMPRIAFSTSSLAPAMYHYQVRGPSGVIGVGKLTIVR